LLFTVDVPVGALCLALFLLANWLVWGGTLAYYGPDYLKFTIMELIPWKSCNKEDTCKPVLVVLIRLYVEAFKLYVLLLIGSLSIAIYNIGQTAKLLANENEKFEIRKVTQFYEEINTNELILFCREQHLSGYKGFDEARVSGVGSNFGNLLPSNHPLWSLGWLHVSQPRHCNPSNYHMLIKIVFLLMAAETKKNVSIINMTSNFIG
jgi:hypothetical protein